MGYWFPSDGTFAPGVAHAIGRLEETRIPRLSLDLDICIAKKVNNDINDTMGGLGLKLLYKASQADKPGWTFDPSIGVALLNNFAKFKTFIDIMTHYEVSIYGSAVIYKWW